VPSNVERVQALFERFNETGESFDPIRWSRAS
jgi:hypothetical protein